MEEGTKGEILVGNKMGKSSRYEGLSEVEIRDDYT